MDRAEITRRFTHHPPRTPEHAQQHESVRGLLLDLAHDLNEILPEGRSKSLCLTALEEAGFHAHAALARDRADEEQEAPGPTETADLDIDDGTVVEAPPGGGRMLYDFLVVFKGSRYVLKGGQPTASARLLATAAAKRAGALSDEDAWEYRTDAGLPVAWNDPISFGHVLYVNLRPGVGA